VENRYGFVVQDTFVSSGLASFDANRLRTISVSFCAPEKSQWPIRGSPSPYGVPVNSEINLKQPLYPKDIGGCARD
jgi:hypothetical protein